MPNPDVCPERHGKHTTAEPNCSVSFVDKLSVGELLTGTPTVTTAAGLTLSSKAISTADEVIDGITYLAGQLVKFHAADGVAGTVYTIDVLCSTDSSPAQVLHAECLFKVY